MPQLPQRLGLDLADTLAGHRERLPDFFERMVRTVFQSKPHLDDFFLARRERAQHLRGLVFEVDVDHGLGGRDHGAVFDEIAKVRIFLFTDGRLQRDRLLGDLEHLAHLGHRDIHALGNLFRRGLAAQFLHQLARRADQLVASLYHVHRNADGAGLVGDGAGNRLPNPPRRVRGELIAPAILELVDGLHQADVAFLDQVEELQSAVGVFLGDGNHQAQVGFDQLALGGFRVYVALDDLALRPLEFLVADARFLFELLKIGAVLALQPAEFFFLVVAARGLDLFFQVVDLAIERTHDVHGLVDPVDQPLAFGVGEPEIADADGNLHLGAPQGPAAAPMLLRFLLLDDALHLLPALLPFLLFFTV